MKTILTLKHAEKEDLFCVVNGNVAKAYDVAETYKNKGYSIKSITPAKMCIYNGFECTIISEHLNFYTLLCNGQEIRVTSTEIELL